MKVISLIILVLACCEVTFAQIVWEGEDDKNWSTDKNWNPQVVPGPSDDVVFPVGNENCNVDISPTVKSISIDAGYTGTITLQNTNITIDAGGDNSFLGGTIIGTGTIIITTTSAAYFDGTDLGADVDLVATLTSSNGIFTGGTATTFGGDVTVTAHSILLNGSTYNGTTILTKSSISAATASVGDGGNEFNGTTTISNEMSAAFISANVNPDKFNGPLTLSLDGTSASCWLQMAHTAAGTEFNNNVRVRSDNTAPGVMYSALATARLTIGANGGTSTLADGYTIDEVTPGFNEAPDPGEFAVGELEINHLTQLGSTAQSINLRIPSADASVSKLRLIISDCVFNGNVDFSASNFYVSTSTFNGTVNNFRKTRGGGTDVTYPPPSLYNSWNGGNTFNNTTNLYNHHNSTLVLGRLNPDIFNGNVTLYSEQSTGHYRIAEGPGTTEFKGNISVSRLGNTSEIRIDFGRGGGTAIFDGSAAQSITFDRPYDDYFIRFENLDIKNANGVQIGLPVTISNNLTLQDGILQVEDSLTFNDDATVTGAADGRYVDSNVLKAGDDAFVFPLGSGGYYHPIGISAPSNVTSVFSAQYFAANHGLGATADGGLVKVSDCEYWALNRLVGTDNPTATLFWNAPYCRVDYITKEDALAVARWSGTLWNNLGQANLTIGAAPDGTDGNLTTSAALPDAASHTLTFGSTDVLNILPVALTSFSVISNGRSAEVSWQTASEHNNDYFTIERLHGNEFIALATVPGAGTSNTMQNYQWIDSRPLPGLSYYRLKQTDFDGTSTYSEVVALQLTHDATPYPNPAKDRIFFSGLNGEEDTSIILRDIAGRVVYSSEASSSIDISNLVPGMYHLGIISNGNAKWFSIRKE